MKTTVYISFGKIIAAVILIMGIIHVAATFTPLIQNGLECLSEDSLKAMTYMSLMCGTFLMLGGLTLIILLRKIIQYPFLNSPVFIISTFLYIGGILSVIYMFDNPFAWIVFVLNIIMFVIALTLKQEIK